MPCDPTIYRGCAAYCARGRAPYSRHLRPTLERELGLRGRGRMLDVGCGPGVVALELAPCSEEGIGLEPPADSPRGDPRQEWPGDTEVVLATKPGGA